MLKKIDQFKHYANEVEVSISDDDIILDPFAGSGSVCIAALKTKRRYVAYDIDKKYCELAERRIKKY